MRDHLAKIRHDLVLAVHPTVLLLLRVVLLHQVVQVQIDQVLAVRLVVLHLHHQDLLVLIAIVAVKTFRRAEVQPIVVVVYTVRVTVGPGLKIVLLPTVLL